MSTFAGAALTRRRPTRLRDDLAPDPSGRRGSSCPTDHGDDETAEETARKLARQPTYLRRGPGHGQQTPRQVEITHVSTERAHVAMVNEPRAQRERPTRLQATPHAAKRNEPRAYVERLASLSGQERLTQLFQAARGRLREATRHYTSQRPRTRPARVHQPEPEEVMR